MSVNPYVDSQSIPSHSRKESNKVIPIGKGITIISHIGEFIFSVRAPAEKTARPMRKGCHHCKRLNNV